MRLPTKHTPGPWRADCEYDELKHVLIAETQGWMIIAKKTRNLAPEDGETEDGFNAYLIESAPDLLSALARQEQGLRNLVEFRLIPASHFDDTLKEADVLASLIAKAEGRS